VTTETDNARITDPARETIDPPPEQDDPEKEGWSRW
jgi:formate dehydrogenase major subunit